MTLRARSKYSAEVGVCSRKRAICSSVSLLIRLRSIVESAAVLVLAIPLLGWVPSPERTEGDPDYAMSANAGRSTAEARDIESEKAAQARAAAAAT